MMIDQQKHEVTEFCPNCDMEITMTWDVKELGYKAYCPVCGNRLMLCDECLHPDGEFFDSCDYCSSTDTCKHSIGRKRKEQTMAKRYFRLELGKEYIQDILPYEELLLQLAEESAELSQAALKLRRAMDGTNPTPVTEEEATKKLIEEFADVLLSCMMLDMHDEDVLDNALETMREKQDRWIERLKDRLVYEKEVERERKSKKESKEE